MTEDMRLTLVNNQAALLRITASLSAYRSWEPTLRAFAWVVDDDAALDFARRADKIGVNAERLLHGIPVGVKDIFDTKGVPTEFGSPMFKGRVPNSSATVVSRLEAAGAMVFGKTVTAELAFYAPGRTTNPWDNRRTPGGSSMGSAAAVAAGIVPVAIGSQTNGSIIRPAAFCGVVGFKPTSERIPTDGVLRFSPTLDQLGTFARTVTDAAFIAAVMAGEPPSVWISRLPARHPRLGVVVSPEWAQIDSWGQENFQSVIASIRAAGGSVEVVEMPAAIASALPLHRLIMAAEANRWVRPLVEPNLHLCSPQLQALLYEGSLVSDHDYELALARRREIVSLFDGWVTKFDAIITPPTLGQAPSIDTTGDPRPCTRWTLIGAPTITIPTGLSPETLPLGTQLVGIRGSDRDLIATAQWLELVLPRLSHPTIPQHSSG